MLFARQQHQLLFDNAESVGNTFVLYRQQTEDFPGQKIKAPGFLLLLWEKAGDEC